MTKLDESPWKFLLFMTYLNETNQHLLMHTYIVNYVAMMCSHVILIQE